MIWITKGTRHLCAPYMIVSNVRGHELWLRSKDKYGILGREISTLDKAKALAERSAREIA